MRVVIDTNILVRALIKPEGTVGPVLEHLQQGDFILLYSDSLFDELIDVLNRPRIRQKYHLTDEDIQTVANLILLKGEVIKTVQQITACRDPKDDKFLEVAVAGKADVIVSGDDDLLVLNPFAGIPIVIAVDFLHSLSE